jgi:hypothetical protein
VLSPAPRSCATEESRTETSAAPRAGVACSSPSRGTRSVRARRAAGRAADLWRGILRSAPESGVADGAARRLAQNDTRSPSPGRNARAADVTGPVRLIAARASRVSRASPRGTSAALVSCRPPRRRGVIPKERAPRFPRHRVPARLKNPGPKLPPRRGPAWRAPVSPAAPAASERGAQPGVHGMWWRGILRSAPESGATDGTARRLAQNDTRSPSRVRNPDAADVTGPVRLTPVRAARVAHAARAPSPPRWHLRNTGILPPTSALHAAGSGFLSRAIKSVDFVKRC